MPQHNYIEDLRLNTYKVGRSPFQKILAQKAKRREAYRHRYYLLPPQYSLYPTGYLWGCLSFESYAFDVEIWLWGEV